MGLFQVNKPKSAAKIMVPTSTKLEDQILQTLEHIANMVGATLGPGGRQLLLERPEMNMRPIITKDGVTVVKHLGYESAVQQLILEAARDAALRTANEAGDGTTTATILSSSIANEVSKMVKANPRLSPQSIVRELQALVPALINQIAKYTLKVNEDNYDDVLLKVATLSANGDTVLAKAVLDAFNVVGEEGNMTIVEVQGSSGYKIEKINGYTIDRGYEESCRNFSNGFINDKSGTMVVLNNPVFILFDGIINDFGQIFSPMSALAQAFAEAKRQDKGIVLVAHGFSESFLGDMYVNWNEARSTAKIFPMLTPELAIMNWRTQFLYDLQAYTGSPVFNPIDRPLTNLVPDTLMKNNRVRYFECSRFRASVIADEDKEAIQLRVDELKEQLKKPESEYELNDLNVRIGKLTSGIARLNISAPVSGDSREKRDRAEDAWMAIRGAIKHGCCPGGGYALVRLSADLLISADSIKKGPRKFAMQILSEAFLQPVRVLYDNYGYKADAIEKQLAKLLSNEDQTFDIPHEAWVDKYEILDSVPAVVEAIRNSISIASLLGTLGGIVAFKREQSSDKEEEKFVRNFETAIGQRGSTAQAEE